MPRADSRHVLDLDVEKWKPLSLNHVTEAAAGIDWTFYAKCQYTYNKKITKGIGTALSAPSKP